MKNSELEFDWQQFERLEILHNFLAKNNEIIVSFY